MAAVEIDDLGVDAIASSVAWFEARLRERQIKLDAQCALRLGLDTLAEQAAKARAGLIQRLPLSEAQRKIIQATSADTLTKVLHWGECAGLTEFERHWRHLKSGNPLITGPSEGHSQERTRTWELVLASLCATFCSRVHDEDPPDVVGLWQGERVGIAAKMLFTATTSALCSRVKEGIDQIERAVVDVGIVAINLADVYPHENEFAAFHRTRIRFPGTLLVSIDEWLDDFIERLGPGEKSWKQLFRGRRRLMAVAFFLPTVVTYRNGHYPVSFPLYRWSSVYAEEREPRAKEFLIALSNAYQQARSFKQLA